MANPFEKRFPLPADVVILTKDGRPSGANTVTVSLDYRKGGENIFSGNPVARGYYVDLRATKVEQQDGFTTEAFALFSTPGYRNLVGPVKRANPKVEARLVAVLADKAQLLVQAFLTNDSATTLGILADLKAAAGAK